MGTSKTEANKSANDSNGTDDTSVENSEKKNAGRRLQDGIISKDPNRKYNLDRRAENSDRRVNADPNYKGPSRRYTVDRRLNTKDRRDKN
ncbi:MAG: hypothetical protein PVG45_01190 [Gammaproteobacteria bacterium]|jgi:hypothetical protein